ncbi:MAG: hypothetical protein MJE68_17355 [Proteobacteria bacterium]|nr:hypothetical protein [Pseudomonadota bacterium]
MWPSDRRGKGRRTTEQAQREGGEGHKGRGGLVEAGGHRVGQSLGIQLLAGQGTGIRAQWRPPGKSCWEGITL